jgi:hypothetical protein
MTVPAARDLCAVSNVRRKTNDEGRIRRWSFVFRRLCAPCQVFCYQC